MSTSSQPLIKNNASLPYIAQPLSCIGTATTAEGGVQTAVMMVEASTSPLPEFTGAATTAEAGVQTMTTVVETTISSLHAIPTASKSVAVTIPSSPAGCLPLGRKMLGVSATELLPPEKGRQVVRLDSDLTAWVHTFKLQDAHKPDVQLKRVAQLVEKHITEGSLDGFRICQGLARNARSAMSMSPSIKSRFEDLLEDPSAFSMAAFVRLKDVQTKFLCMATVIV
ncbi:hypothetical protein DXG01_004837, partial [Tephrocybe rancida]